MKFPAVEELANAKTNWLTPRTIWKSTTYFMTSGDSVSP